MSEPGVVVIGAGQAGLSVSHELSAAGVDHVVLERGRVGETWRGRWDTFCLVTPNWTVRLPGGAYAGDDPDGFMPRDAIVVPSMRAAMWIRSVPFCVSCLWSRKWTSRPITHSCARPNSQISTPEARRQTGLAANGLISGSNRAGGSTIRIEAKKIVHSTGDAQRAAVNVFEWTETSLVGRVA